MKHLLNKRIFQGGGKSKPKPQPAVLRPPEIGNFQILNSYSVAEIVDLISDGPIQGLVNQNGESLRDGKSILQGIYLDNTPIEVTNSQSIKPQNEDLISSASIQSIFNKLGDIYYANNKYKTYHHEPTANIKELNTKVDEARLFISRVMYNGKLKSLYSPLNNGTIGESGNGWIWNGSLKDEALPRYFSNTGSHVIEVHYQKSSLNQTGTILNDFKKEINNEKNKSSNSPLQNEICKKAIRDLDTVLEANADDKPFNWQDDDDLLVVIKLGSSFTNPLTMSKKQAWPTLANDPADAKKLISTFFTLGDFENSFSSSDITTILLPKINSNNKFSTALFGCLILKINTSARKYDFTTPRLGAQSSILGVHNRIFLNNIIPLANKNIELKFFKGQEPKNRSRAAKYNFLNVSCEFKNGKEYQDPLQFFNNVYVDYDYNAELFGPFKSSYPVQRVQNLKAKNTNNVNLNISAAKAILKGEEGSDDRRNKNSTDDTNYSNWNSQNFLDEEASTITHTIENPNVSSVYFTLGISALSDTVEIDKKKNVMLTDKKVSAGSKIPSIVNIKVETGKITNGKINKSDQKKRIFSIVALIEGQMLIDFGAPNFKDIAKKLDPAIKEFSAEDGSLKGVNNLEDPVRFDLPDFESDENPTTTKRYIKITKLSAETNSTLINKTIFLSKVTEIIQNKLSYPFSAIAGIKIDARAFSSVPERSYDCRLKKIKIPNNYEPLKPDGSDKRYLKKQSDNTSTNQIYIGDWDGGFKIGWTDNPAWIIYDLLTSKRYGLGSYIDESQINKWELYKIARFCDAVDDDGFFIGVSDGVGGLEPRYSCNVVFKEQTKIFDAINIIASLFRGVVFFSNSEIHFLDDRPRTPIALFSNTNVKDGVFNYGNNRRDQQFNTVEVAYLDRFDNYQSKIEYIQDEADIRKRGVFKTTINTMGVTSRAMARRIGQHLIYQTIKENQTVEFFAGLESLLCRPGDLVIVEDELKTRASNYGRILDVNLSEKSLTVDNSFISGSMANTITVYTPTGYSSSTDLNNLSMIKRSRVDYFDVTGNLLNGSDSILTGRYYFSGYMTGFPTGINEELPQQFPLYTGLALSGHKLYCYYNTGATGFVFATGKAFQNDTAYDKVITNTGVFNIFDIQSRSSSSIANADYSGFRYTTSSNKRTSPSGQISGALEFYQEKAYDGLLNSDIESANHTQITKFALSGYNNLDFGSKVYIDSGDINANLISIISVGSPYRLERKDASDQIYKIISIREQNQNEYSIVASKYNTGKFEEIEKFASQDFLPDTYYNGPTTISNLNVDQLPSPTIYTFTEINKTATNFSLSGSWSGSALSTGTMVEIYNNISNEYYSDITSNTSYLLTGLSSLGQWKLKITSLGNNSTTLNSPSIETGAFVAYSTIIQLSQPAVTQFTLL